MYIQKKIKELETERDYLQYEIQDIENLQYDEKLKIYKEVQTYEQKLIKESEIGKLEKEIKEREKKISLINKMIRKKAEKYRERLQTKKQKLFESYDRSIDEKTKQANKTVLNEHIMFGQLVEEVESIAGKKCKTKLSIVRGSICSMCKVMSIKDAMSIINTEEYDLIVKVKIGTYEFLSTININDETFTGKTVYECLKRVGAFGLYTLSPSLKFKDSEVKNIFIKIDEKTFNKIYNEEKSRGENYVLSQAISNLVENADTLNK